MKVITIAIRPIWKLEIWRLLIRVHQPAPGPKIRVPSCSRKRSVLPSGGMPAALATFWTPNVGLSFDWPGISASPSA